MVSGGTYWNKQEGHRLDNRPTSSNNIANHTRKDTHMTETATSLASNFCHYQSALWNIALNDAPRNQTRNSNMVISN